MVGFPFSGIPIVRLNLFRQRMQRIGEIVHRKFSARRIFDARDFFRDKLIFLRRNNFFP